jgi:hypothetical protein
MAWNSLYISCLMWMRIFICRVQSLWETSWSSFGYEPKKTDPSWGALES